MALQPLHSFFVCVEGLGGVAAKALTVFGPPRKLGVRHRCHPYVAPGSGLPCRERHRDR